MKVTRCAIPELLLIEPQIYGDSRGTFLETYNERAFAALGCGNTSSRITFRLRSAT